MEGFAVTCPHAPDASRLISGFCSSPRSFGLGFLQTPPHGDALALLLAFGSANTWQEDFHLFSSVPCLAHTGCNSAAPAKGHRRCSKPRPPHVSTADDSSSVRWSCWGWALPALFFTK